MRASGDEFPRGPELLLEKVDRILSLLETRPNPAPRRSAREKAAKGKPVPVGRDDIKRDQERLRGSMGFGMPARRFR
jgi:hypothetical protein